MKLSDLLVTDFDSGVRSRGREYYRAGRVRITSGSDRHVSATVKGTRRYAVELNWEESRLFAFCDCPYAGSDGACKHLWATVLATEDRGYLAAAARNGRLKTIYESLDFQEFEDEFEDENDFDLVAAAPAARAPRSKSRNVGPKWRQQIAAIDEQRSTEWRDNSGEWPNRRQLLYVVDTPASHSEACLILELLTRERKRNGDGWNQSKELRWRRRDIPRLPEESDREILALLGGGRQHYGWGYTDYDLLPARYQVPHPLSGRIAPLICQTGRCFLRGGRDDLLPLAWSVGEPWRFSLELARQNGKRWRVEGAFRRGDERMRAAEVTLLIPGGLVFAEGRVAPLDENTPFEWVRALRAGECIEAPDADRDQLLAMLLEHPTAPPLVVPDELRYEEMAVTPRPCLKIRASGPYESDRQNLLGELAFDYAGRLVGDQDRGGGFYDAKQRRFLRRDGLAEEAARRWLREFGLKFEARTHWDPEPAWQVPAKKLPPLVHALIGAGWHVEAQGKTFRRPGAPRIEVTSGVDWFELHGEVQYGETSAKLPALLEALRRGENMVRLDDGTYGMLPEDWLGRLGPLAGLGTVASGHIRFRRNQAGLLDALLAAQPEAKFDETFEHVRQELRRFEGIQAAEQPAGFVGQLRDYQREGLGWMDFLNRFGFGGCLADDMGVGKTAQVLALLEARRHLRAANGHGGTAPSGPSLVVVPRSLVFNWKQEAAHFAPQLRVLDHTGLARTVEQFDHCDVVITTYGTLRRDAALFRDIEFDYVVLDEAQAIKNASTESAKAARLLRGRHRLALSGTPVENHLGELWSLFEFLNPGMLGAAGVFRLAGGARKPDEDTRKLLAHALRPFILRRTKQQVARELPAKTEQTVYCDMEPSQRRLYDELRAHYRNTLLKRIEQDGLAKSKMHVLEALLRLRQAACHPGLLDPARSAEPSAKIDLLLDQLPQVVEENHKTLVFSQFTSLLKIVRDRLDSAGTTYEYLDGRTRDRQTRVERFQNDPDCRLFLISLKAGGLGLNLTAAEYVFLLDPWWNPAVEAQAIDRTHRIGQTRQVFAYRLIARDTVEEKVLELQNTKRDLASAIIGADNSIIGSLRKEDLELLLS